MKARAFFARTAALLALACMFTASTARAYAPFVAPTDVDEMFDAMELLMDNFTLLFAVVVVLAVLVTGFFLGRKWLRRVG